ncbi:NAD(P)H nitroreductase [Nocardia uniformis]|uniref:NAD(P)H nitroreductase n=1 Tax=Nocardia uniformis TaxID=53432 RepID=A0A849C2W2_9NOCA|nr:NAD(P)H nitroreductase [Nocardia uniformis]NNH69319.1 NAD(P)H nitroreductase [Nocardia uniformis]
MNPHPTGEIIEKAVLLAGRAPSLHNSQPWHWVFDGAALRLYAVPDRRLPATDTAGRQRLLSCGIALDHLRVAMAAAGWRCSVARFPDPNRREHLATITFPPATVVTDADRDRAAAITRRHTDRRTFAAPTGWTDFETVLRTLIDPTDVLLTVLPPQSRPRLAHASELTAALRRYDSEYQAELHWWTGHTIASSGVPRRALSTAQERARVDVGRSFPNELAATARVELPSDRSTVIVLSTDTDTAEDLVRCGESLSTVLLESTVAGFSTCPLTHLIELRGSRAIVRELTGRSELPQVLVRIGIAAEPDDDVLPTPRRPLAEILEMPGGG